MATSTPARTPSGTRWVAGAAQWPGEGWPENSREWLTTVASRRLADQLRSDAARGGRRLMPSALRPRLPVESPPPGRRRAPGVTDRGGGTSRPPRPEPGRSGEAVGDDLTVCGPDASMR